MSPTTGQYPLHLWKESDLMSPTTGQYPLHLWTKFIWIDCNNKIGKIHFIKSKKIEDITHNFSYVSLLK